jgi:biotin-dependent carboxylase-like uncharacterized protein
MKIDVVSPGLATSVQDLGRPSYYHLGIPPSGALDQYSAIAANLLVGNDQSAAVLECAYVGPQLRFTGPGTVAITGATSTVKLGGAEIPMWETVAVQDGDTIEFAFYSAGARTYIAFAGGIDVPQVLGSRSTYTLGTMGGFAGRVLAAGDILSTGPTIGCVRAAVPERLRPTHAKEIAIKVVPGLYEHKLTEASRQAFYDTVWTLTPVADRVGFRYRGAQLEMINQEQPFGAGHDPSNIVDAPYPIGSIQVPGGVEPIILHRDAVSGGGYMMTGTVISAHMDAVGQSTPGCKTQFVPVTVEQALAERRRRAERLANLQSLLSERR